MLKKRNVEELSEKQKALELIIQKTEKIIKGSRDFVRELEELNKKAVELDARIKKAIEEFDNMKPEKLDELEKEWDDIQKTVEKVLREF